MKTLLEIDASNLKYKKKDDIIKVKFKNEDSFQVNFTKFFNQSQYFQEKYKYMESLDSFQSEIEEITETIDEESIKFFFQLLQEEKIVIPIDRYKDIYRVTEHFIIPQFTTMLDDIRRKELSQDLNFNIQILQDSETTNDIFETKLTSQIENFLRIRINECFKNEEFGKLKVPTICRIIDQKSEEKVNQNLLIDFIFESAATRFILFRYIELHELDEEKVDELIKFVCEQDEDSRKMCLDYMPFDFSFIQKMRNKYEQTNEELNQVNEELNETKIKYEQSNEELNQTKEKLNQAIKELNQSKSRNEQTKQELSQINRMLDQTKIKYEQTNERLDQVNEELNEIKCRYEQLKQELNQAKQESNDTSIKYKQTKEDLNQAKQESKEMRIEKENDQLNLIQNTEITHKDKTKPNLENFIEKGENQEEDKNKQSLIEKEKEQNAVDENKEENEKKENVVDEKGEEENYEITDNSISILGQFDKEQIRLENDLINMKKDSEIVTLKLTPGIHQFPIEGYESKANIFILNDEPKPQMKNLLSKMKIIIFTFNLKQTKSLTFLEERWFPIIEQFDKNNQERILVGIFPKPSKATKSTDYRLKTIYQKVKTIQEKLQFSKYFEYGKPPKSLTRPSKIGIKINKELHQYIQKQLQPIENEEEFLEEEAEENNSHKGQNKEENDQPNHIQNIEITQSDKIIHKLENIIEKRENEEDKNKQSLIEKEKEQDAVDENKEENEKKENVVDEKGEEENYEITDNSISILGQFDKNDEKHDDYTLNAKDKKGKDDEDKLGIKNTNDEKHNKNITDNDDEKGKDKDKKLEKMKN